MERQYAPYPKWFGTAFMRLNPGPELSPILRQALRAETYQERGEALAEAYEYLAVKHNALAITKPITNHSVHNSGHGRSRSSGAIVSPTPSWRNHRPGRAAPHQRRTDRRHRSVQR